MEKKRLNNEGFSLIELIIVIAIMAILVGALAPQLIKYIEKSRQAADIQAVGAVYTAMMTAYADPSLESTDLPTTTTAVAIYTVGATTGTTKYWDLVKDTVPEASVTLKSVAYKGTASDIKFCINSNGQIELTVADKTNPASKGPGNLTINESGSKQGSGSTSTPSTSSSSDG